jgi:hypothetical protein
MYNIHSGSCVLQEIALDCSKCSSNKIFNRYDITFEKRNLFFTFFFSASLYVSLNAPFFTAYRRNSFSLQKSIWIELKSLWIEFVTIFLNTFFCLKNHLGNCPENFHEVFDRKSFWSAEMSFDNFHKISSGSWENFELWIQFIWIRTFSLLGTFNNSSDFYFKCIEMCKDAWKAHQKLNCSNMLKFR